MSDKMRYEEFEATIEYDAGNDSLFGIVANTDGKVIVTFYGKSVEELHKEFQESIKVWRSVCAEQKV